MKRKVYEGNLKFVKENCTTFKELKEFKEAVTESGRIANAINTKLIEAFLSKSDIDFDDIPSTRGRLDKYLGFSAITESLEILDKARRNGKGKNVKYDNISTITTTISNIIGLGDKFELAYRTDNTLLTTMYCTLVVAVIEATSYEISESIDDDGKVIIGKVTKPNHIITVLEDFNTKMADTTIPAEINKILANGEKNLIGGIGGSIVLITGAFLGIIPALRELIYFFYNSRMKVSELIDQQVYFIESNKRNLDNGTIPSHKRKEIIKKQNFILRKLSAISDRLRVDHASAIKGANQDIKEDNKKWTLKKLDEETINDQMIF